MLDDGAVRSAATFTRARDDAADGDDDPADAPARAARRAGALRNPDAVANAAALLGDGPVARRAPKQRPWKQRDPNARPPPIGAGVGQMRHGAGHHQQVAAELGFMRERYAKERTRANRGQG